MSDERGKRSMVSQQNRMEGSSATGAQETVGPLEIRFEKSESYRSVHVSAVWFSCDPHQNWHFSFYNEHPPLPEKLVLQLDSGGNVVGQDSIVQASGFIRRIEVDVSFTLEGAVQFYKALGENLKNVKAI